MANTDSPSSTPRGSSGRGGRHIPHYYTPREVKLIAGVTHTEEKRTDLYGGRAADLVASGLLTFDMLPPEGTGSITWLAPSGRYQEGYMQVRRRTAPGMFTVEIWCSEKEIARRQHQAEERREQWRRERELEEQQEREAVPEKRTVLEAYRGMPTNFKPVAVIAIEELGKAQSDAEKTCWLSVWRACCAAANHGVQASPTRGHLRLAWSAPEAPAWVTDL